MSKLSRRNSSLLGVAANSLTQRIIIGVFFSSLLGCIQSPYAIRDEQETKGLISETLKSLPANVDVAFAQHSTERNKATGVYSSTYRIGLVCNEPIRNREQAAIVQEMAKSVCYAIFDLIDKDKELAKYTVGRGTLSLVVHDSQLSHDGFLQFQQESADEIDKLSFAMSHRKMSRKFIPLLGYSVRAIEK